MWLPEWTTHDELAYLEGLGTHTIAGRRAVADGDSIIRHRRGRLLTAYLNAPPRNWGDVDAAAAMAHARECLAHVEFWSPATHAEV